MAVVVMAPALWYVFRRERFGKFWSISQHAAAHRDTTVALGAGMLAAAAFLAIYFQQYLIPKYDYGWPMRVALWTSIACCVLLALVPHYDSRWQGRVHVFISWVMVVLMPSVLLLHSLHTFGNVSSLVAAMGICLQLSLLGIFYGVKGMYEKFALLQSIFIMVYLLSLGIIGYM
ncbi:hypothetical protein IPL68_03310 [Candidatus Saccharibacteria bacterium]|nr:MAG: hypothetical protein IPL68_03310 [Candidatus Saccharibacteria bacterium]